MTSNSTIEERVRSSRKRRQYSTPPPPRAPIVASQIEHALVVAPRLHKVGLLDYKLAHKGWGRVQGRDSKPAKRASEARNVDSISCVCVCDHDCSLFRFFFRPVSLLCGGRLNPPRRTVLRPARRPALRLLGRSREPGARALNAPRHRSKTGYTLNWRWQTNWLHVSGCTRREIWARWVFALHRLISCVRNSV